MTTNFSFIVSTSISISSISRLISICDLAFLASSHSKYLIPNHTLLSTIHQTFPSQLQGPAGLLQHQPQHSSHRYISMLLNTLKGMECESKVDEPYHLACQLFCSLYSTINLASVYVAPTGIACLHQRSEIQQCVAFHLIYPQV